MKPVLQALILADNVYQDKETGKFIIAGTFTGMVNIKPKENTEGEQSEQEQTEQNQKRLPSMIAPGQTPGSPNAYICMTDFAGESNFSLRYVDLSTYEIKLEAKLKISCQNKLETIQLHIPIPNLPKDVGEYALEFLHQDEPLGSWRVSITTAQR